MVVISFIPTEDSDKVFILDAFRRFFGRRGAYDIFVFNPVLLFIKVNWNLRYLGKVCDYSYSMATAASEITNRGLSNVSDSKLAEARQHLIFTFEIKVFN